MAPKRTTRANSASTTATTSVTNAQLKAIIDQGVTDALAARDADRNTNGDDNHNSGTGVRRTERVARECTYPDFMKCQPLNFKGTEGVVELIQWFEKMETVFSINNCFVENQIKFSTCTLLASALTWSNSYVRTVSHDVAYAMTWTDLKKKMSDKYCPRGEIKKLEAELSNLKVKGTDMIGYNQHFQELALLCVRMFPEESDKIERYFGGLPDMIHGCVVASKPKTMQEAIEIATGLMDKKICTFAERQSENKRKQDDNHQQQQQNKRKNTGRAYTAGSGEKKPYGGSKPLCSKCNYHHDGQCDPKCHKCNRVGHPARDCRSTTNANAANNQRGIGAGQKPTCYECRAQGHFKRDCPKLKNNNRGNQGGNGNDPAKVYAVGRAGINPDSNVVMDLSKATNPLQAKELLQIKEMADQDTPPPTITAMKIPIIKKGEYDIWSMRIRQYICHTDHNLWDIIVNGDLKDEATPSGEQSSPPVPKTAKQLAARRNQERIKSILLLAIPDEYLLKFHNVPDAKSLWAAIKSRFGGNEESKKMQKNVLKHQFENFVTASNETLDKAYDRFQKLISQLEIHGAYVSKEDINQKVYKDELKRSPGSNSASHNLSFLSFENTNSTNEVSTASGDFGISIAGGINQVSSTQSAHNIAYSFLTQPTTSPQLENEDFQQMDGDDLEELDLRWQVAMLTVRIECYNYHRKGYFARECRFVRSQGRRPYGDRSNAQTTESSSQALVAQDGLRGYDWSNDFEVELVNYALMAISSSNSSSSSDS
ncbi:reverse transcriptase domain-containing protein, partial [Tanacetum coccineum]